MRRRAIISSIALANQIVQVRTEAKARPTITALTTMSAVMNMPQGDRSRGSLSTTSGTGGVGGAASGVEDAGAAASAGAAAGVVGTGAGVCANAKAGSSSPTAISAANNGSLKQ